MPSKDFKKEKKQFINLFIPPLLDSNQLSVVLTGQRGTSALLRGVMHLYTYIYSDTLTLLRTEKEEDEYFPGYTQISRTILRSFLGDNYTGVMKILLDNNYLTMLCHNKAGEYFPEGFYFKGDYTGRCKSFRVPGHLQGDGKLYKIVREPLTKRDYNKLQALNAHRVAYHEHFRDMIAANMGSVLLQDTPESRTIITDLFTQQKIRVSAEELIQLFNTTPIKLNPICDFGHRVHSHVVNTNKVLRPHMRFRGELAEPLVEIDLVNSQPAILASITPKLILKYAPECSQAAPLYAQVIDDKNYQHYQELCATGLIYEHLRDAFNQAYRDKLTQPITRDEAKKVYYCGAYSNYNALDRYKLETVEKEVLTLILQGAPDNKIEELKDHLFTLRSYLVFKQEFQGVHDLFRKIKQMEWSFNPGEKHANNCLLAQRIESQIIYTRIVKSLIEGGIPSDKIVTIHDALMVRQQDEAKARKIIKLELNKLKLKIKLKSKC